MTDKATFNRLTKEKSSYLKQHSQNPVHWWSYGPEALQRAKDEDKPIFLSIGYASCHFCSRMNEESFSDDVTAEFINENFIPIKVDKEEFPDIDTYYQVAAQLYTRSGGWPLSAFLLPDTRPFYAATYFPKEAKGEVPSFMNILEEMKRVYTQEYEQAEENAEKITEAIKNGLVPKDKVEYEGHFPAPMAVMKAIEQFKDNENGGFGDAPKFPNYSFYNWAVEQMLEGMISPEEGEHIVKSIERMLMGGVNDHARGGFHRYSVDNSWTVPHFEKMLYDQAGLLRLLSKTSLIYPSPLVFDTIINTLNYIETEMFSNDGFFFSAQSANSEGVEGLYYTYTSDEFEDLVNSADTDDELLGKSLEDIKKWFNITPEGNFQSPLNVISLNHEHKDAFYSQEGWEKVRRVRSAISEDKKDRIPPATDTKGVASWNFQMATALIDLMQYCRVDVIRLKANEIFNKVIDGIYNTFIVSKDSEKMVIKHSTTRDLNTPYLEDYVFFAEFQLRTYEVTGNPVFKDNFELTLNYIMSEFIKDGSAFTRALSTTEHELFPNQEVGAFDNSFRSPVSTLITVARRAKVILQDQEYTDPLNELVETITHEALKSPINCGEALQALTYPDNVYRSVRVPASWPKEPKFISYLPYFLTRFVITYHTDNTDEWQICGVTECELQGNGIDNFLETLTPKAPEEEETK